jgi:LmbE family N-acetylglucosaminyl deacetylase
MKPQRVLIVGMVGGSGRTTTTAELASQRGAAIRDALTVLGVPQTVFEIHSAPEGVDPSRFMQVVLLR